MSKKFVGAQLFTVLFPLSVGGEECVWSTTSAVTNAEPDAASTGTAPPDTAAAIAPLASADPLIRPAFFMLWHPISTTKHTIKSADKVADRRQVTRPLGQC